MSKNRWSKIGIFLFSISFLLVGLQVIVLAEEVTPRQVEAEIEDYNEAPMLSEMVEDGELPPVSERLPKEPVVVKPYEEIGEYGGTWRNMSHSTADMGHLHSHVNYNHFVRLKGDLSGEFEADLADWWEVSDDGTEYTIHIREGLKWSDGEPVTAEDVVFYFEDVLHEGIETYPPTQFEQDGELAEVEKIDNQTFKVIFPEPYGMFLFDIAKIWQDIPWNYSPKHYLKQFHPNYVDKEELKDMAQEEGFESWEQLFNDKMDIYKNPDLPSIGPWVLEHGRDEQGTLAFVRNPYSHRVDTEGNQLPYIDRVEFILRQEHEMAVMEAITGNLDFHARILRAQDLPTVLDNQEEGNYRVYPYPSPKGGELTVYFNLTTEDPELKKIFQDKRFRQAASLAMDREELNDIMFKGLAEPRQISPTEASPFYSQEAEEYYAEYDPERARTILDEMGLDEKDDDGYRLLPNGDRFNIVFEVSTERGWDDGYELIADYLENIGIEVSLQARDQGLFVERLENNKVEMWSWSWVGDIHALDHYLPTGTFQGVAPLWGDWLETDGEEGENPPEDVEKIDELVQKIRAETDDKDRVEYGKELVKTYVIDNLFAVGLLSAPPRVGVVHNRMKNVKTHEETYYSPFIPCPSATSYSEQFYIDPDMEK